MPNYLRYRDGNLFFFTLVTHRRRPTFVEAPARQLLRDAIDVTRQGHPWTTEAIVLLPDHIHMLWRLPENDTDYTRRIAALKKRFTRAYLAAGGIEGDLSPSQRRQRCRGIW
jgi:putative transposase